MVEKISRSEQKRLLKQIEELAQELTVLSDSELKQLPAEQEIRDEILACRGLKGGALKRQTKYLAKVMRDLPLDEIYLFMQRRKGSALQDKQQFHRAERWRDILINEALEINQRCQAAQVSFEPDYPSELLDDLAEELPALDIPEIRRLVASYARTHSKQHNRELFRIIKAAVEMDARSVP